MSDSRAINRRVMNMVARGVIEDTNDETGMQLEQVSLLNSEGKIAIERMQNYGFSSSPPSQSEAVVVFVGGGRDHGVIVGTDDRASRFTGLAPGEVAIYCNNGDSIVFKQDNSIELTTKKLIIKADELELEAADIAIKGNMELDGNLNATGSINAPQGSVGGGSEEEEREPDG